MTARAFDHAIVLGGSIAGLVTARVLSERFCRVTVIERDGYPKAAAPRRGVPQGKLLHVVLARGRATLDALFPRLAADLRAAGGVTFDYGRGASVHYGRSSLAPFDSDLSVHGCTQPLLESLIRRYVSELANVTVRDATSALGLLASPDRRRVNGVRVASAGETEEVVLGQLVVDATGRGSHAPAWLEQFGYRPPGESIVAARLTYASRTYVPATDYRPNWALLASMARAPQQPRSGVILAVEGGQWMTGIATIGDDHLPADEEGFTSFVHGLSSPVVHEALQHATASGPIVRSRTTQNRLRHYERASAWPDDFVLLGDSVCALNPIYGQGITLAVLGAVLLGEHIDVERRARARIGSGFAAGYQRRLAQLNRAAWQYAASSDATWPGTRYEPQPTRTTTLLRALPTRALRAYGTMVLDTAYEVPAVARAVMEISHMQRAASALIAPSLMLRVIGHRVRAAAPRRNRDAPG